jgi:CHAD domain-containing protein
METVIPTTEPTINPKADESQAGRSLKEIISSQITLLASYVTPVMETDDVEAVHKMRVTTRRLQASLDLLQTGEDRLKVRKLKRLLRDWRRVLSEVRNYDVFLLVIEKESASRHSSRHQSFEHLKEILQKRRAERLAKARRHLKKIRLEVITSRLGLEIDLTSAALPTEAEKNSEEKAPDRAIASKPELTDEKAITLRAAQRIEQRVSEFLALAAQSEPATDPADLHQLRIAAKRLRYILELVSDMGYGDTARALAWLRLLQDRIGDWHDLEAIEGEIISIVSRRKFLKEGLAESGSMLQAAAHLQSKKKSLVAKLFPVKVPRTISATSRRLVRSLRGTRARQRSKPLSTNS